MLLIRLRHCALLPLLLLLLASPAWANSLRYCDADTTASAATQSRLLGVAAVVKAELERSAQSVALIARSGLALQHFNQRYSHAGVSLKASAHTPWSVRQLYYACDAQRPYIFDQGLSGFVLGTSDMAEGYISLIFLPNDAAAALERAALDNALGLQLLADTYSANAYPFNPRYQNCNQWVVELLASAWGATPGDAPRSQAQQWLRENGFVPTEFHLGSRPMVWLARQIRWLHTDDHPEEDLDMARFKVSMPQSIEAFVRTRLPQATRVELCYTRHHLVVRRGWEPIADGCTPGNKDALIKLPLN